ncbi:type II secretion system protein GspE [candidate division TM6 bacterium RIFCSPHIGHO2_12_FULL_32_22]|nr:MAG: type II secretion system protein GspE [candidate division TM6 bacterium RIFCSPHIGHO2_12_FULL_32_22]
MYKDLGETLVEMQAISQEELNDYRKKSEDENLSLDQYLKINKLVDQEKIARAYSKMLGVPFIEKITEEIVDSALLSAVPFRFLRDSLSIPVNYENQITIATANPNNFQAIDELNLIFSGSGKIAIATESSIIDALNRFYPLEGTKEVIDELGEEKELEAESFEFGELEEQDILGMAQEAPIIKLVNQIIFQAYKRDASDIHIEPFEKEIRVRFRIDGVLHEVFTPPKRLQGALVSRIKIMSNLNIAEKRIPQDGRIQIKIADKNIDIRVSVLPSAFGEKIVLRLLDKSKSFADLKDIGLGAHDYTVLMHAISQPNGIILVSGPTGSGKTSTLYSILNKLNSPEVSIVTVEDPIEYQMAGISQVQVNDKVGLTFAVALRAILRQDPDIIMIGETRDQETAKIAIQSSLTGHLVLSTIHTNSAAVTITRIIDMGIEPFLIASSVTLVIAQRLVRKLCPNCKVKYKPDPAVLKSLGLTEKDAESITFYKPVGCKECSETGYKGRLAIFEMMPMSNDIAKLTVQRSDAKVIQDAAVKEGMILLVQDGLDKIKEGLTSVDEVLSAATGVEGFE